MFEEVKELLISIIALGFFADTQKNRNRKIIFWYDPKKEYEELIDELEIENTEIIKYDNNSLWIRYHIEKEQTDKNIVIYLPIERQKGIDNELLDLETANLDLLFNPDSTTMRLKNLRLDDECRNVIKKYTKFFNNKNRETEFKEFDIEKNSENIDLIITAILLNIKTINLDDILKNIIKLYFEDSKKYDSLFKFGNEKFILSLFNETFGCKVEKYDDLKDIYKSLVFTYFATTIKNIEKVNRYGKYLLMEKATNVQVFVNSLMRDKSTKKYFEIISDNVIKEFGIKELLHEMEIDEYIETDAFKLIDENIISYITEQLIKGIPDYKQYQDLIDIRESKYWYETYINEYEFLKVTKTYFETIDKMQNSIKALEFEYFAKEYVDKLYNVDTLYRKMYYYFDNIYDKDSYINLKNIVENNYINTYMMELSIKWSQAVENLNRYDSTKITMQNKFYNTYVKPFTETNKNGRTIVIISDALRYECAKELNDKLKKFGTKSELKYMQGLVPSYTTLGMAALLPNNQLSIINSGEDVLVDGENCSSTKEREKILQKKVPESLAIQYEKLYEMTKIEWKKLFSGKKVVYIYHDIIDNTGEHDENNVFSACEKAIGQLEKLVKDLHTTFSGINAFITADHGFFYKRGRVETYQKIEKDLNSTKQKSRYSFADEEATEEGIISVDLNYIPGETKGYVNIPKGHNVFSMQGGGKNYIHGGILPQEIIIPVVDFKSSRTSEESKKVGITYSGLTTRITNAITYLEFLQDTNVDENNLPCRYLLHFEDEQGNRISDECTIVASYSSTEVKDRFFKEKFVFKNINYEQRKNYYLVIIDEETGIETQRIKFIIDIVLIF